MIDQRCNAEVVRHRDYSCGAASDFHGIPCPPQADTNINYVKEQNL